MMESLGVKMKILFILGVRGGLSRVDDVPLDQFESQRRRINGSGSFLIKIIYSLKCEVMSICTYILIQEGLTVRSYPS